jgi:RNA polymerase sigma-70 factor, ECF subfamily
VGQFDPKCAGSKSDLKHLLAAAKEGSDSALGRALSVCRPGLLLAAQKAISPRLRRVFGASDIVQDTFVNATRGFASFRGQRASEFVNWLGKILSNRLSQIVRRYGRGANGNAAVMNRGATVDGRRCDEEPSPSGVAEIEELARLVQIGLSRLCERDQQILHLRLGDGLKFAQIGEGLGISANGARLSFLRATQRLRAQLPECCGTQWL